MKHVRPIGIGLLVLISKILSFNWIIGSCHLKFSWTTMMAPVIASQFGMSWISLFFIHQKLWAGQSIWMVFLYRMPLIFASYSFSKRTKTTSLLIPALCMSMFVIHDVGSVAWYYSLYWLIPIALFFVHDCMVSRALSASFVAHAVGSVIWLYTGNIPVLVWIGLIPVVFCERLLMAAGMFRIKYFSCKNSTGMSWWQLCAVRLGIHDSNHLAFDHGW